MKQCTNCKEIKNYTDFSKDISKKDGLYPRCKSCKVIYQKKYAIENADKIKKYREENKEILYQKKKNYKKLYPDKHKEWYKLWAINNKEKRKAYMKQYRQDNKENIKESKANYVENNPDIALKLKIAKNLRTRITYAFKNKKFIKEEETIKMLGCDFEFLIKHIESLFSEGMNWNNYGIKGWHIDHIKPISLGRNYEEMCSLNHYTNLQPLWAKENIRKGNKYEENR